jgi:hypothetical protein
MRPNDQQFMVIIPKQPTYRVVFDLMKKKKKTKKNLKAIFFMKNYPFLEIRILIFFLFKILKIKRRALIDFLKIAFLPARTS